MCDELGVGNHQFLRWRDELELLGKDACPGTAVTRDQVFRSTPSGQINADIYITSLTRLTLLIVPKQRICDFITECVVFKCCCKFGILTSHLSNDFFNWCVGK